MITGAIGLTLLAPFFTWAFFVIPEVASASARTAPVRERFAFRAVGFVGLPAAAVVFSVLDFLKDAVVVFSASFVASEALLAAPRVAATAAVAGFLLVCAGFLFPAPSRLLFLSPSGLGFLAGGLTFSASAPVPADVQQRCIEMNRHRGEGGKGYRPRSTILSSTTGSKAKEDQCVLACAPQNSHHAKR